MQAYILVHVRDEHDAHLFRDKYPVYVRIRTGSACRPVGPNVQGDPGKKRTYDGHWTFRRKTRGLWWRMANCHLAPDSSITRHASGLVPGVWWVGSEFGVIWPDLMLFGDGGIMRVVSGFGSY